MRWRRSNGDGYVLSLLMSVYQKKRKKEQVERTKYRTPSHQTTIILICLPCSPVLLVTALHGRHAVPERREVFPTTRDHHSKMT